MNRSDLLAEIKTFLDDEYTETEEIDLGEAAAKVEELISGLEDEEDDDDKDEGGSEK